MTRLVIEKMIQNLPSWGPKSTKLGSKIHQNRIPNRLWRGLVGILAPRGPKKPQEKKKRSENGELWPPLHPQVGAQNRSKSVPRAIKNMIIFLVDLKIDFWRDLVPTWAHIGPQNLPK